jgi:hypothetical protein
MKAKNTFTGKEIKLYIKYPLIGTHQLATNMLAAAELCSLSIAENETALASILEGPKPLLPSEHEEYHFVINELTKHIAFCENALIEVKSQLNEIAVHLN